MDQLQRLKSSCRSSFGGPALPTPSVAQLCDLKVLNGPTRIWLGFSFLILLQATHISRALRKRGVKRGG